MCTDALGNQESPFRLSSSPSSWWVRLPGDLPETSVINNSKASSCSSVFRCMRHVLQMYNASLQICCKFTVHWWTIVISCASMTDCDAKVDITERLFWDQVPPWPRAATGEAQQNRTSRNAT